MSRKKKGGYGEVRARGLNDARVVSSLETQGQTEGVGVGAVVWARERLVLWLVTDIYSGLVMREGMVREIGLTPRSTPFSSYYCEKPFPCTDTTLGARESTWPFPPQYLAEVQCPAASATPELSNHAPVRGIWGDRGNWEGGWIGQ